MTSGKEHDKSTKIWSIPFALLIGLLVDLQSGVISWAAFLTGGLWLSPDLDTNSLALKRWGILKYLWWPYQKIIPHRSIFSHGPFIGTALRVSYLLSMIMIFIFIIQPSEFSGLLDTAGFISKFVKQYQKDCLAVLLGLEASAWLHLIKDGDPMPQEWSKRSHK